MNAIVGYTHILKSSSPTPAQTERLIKIEGATNHLLSIINNILDLSKIEAGRMELEQISFPLDAVMTYVRSMISEQAKTKNLRIHVDTTNVPNWIKGDLTRLRQALLNYAGNAVKFTGSGSITLRGLLISEDDTGLLIRFEVQDTGPGVSAESRSRLFEEFEQADTSTTRQHGGTGLGLAITRRLAKLMGGTVGVDSELDQGSTFWFTAKLARGQAESALQSAASQTDMLEELKNNHAGSRLLLAEDDFFNQELAKLMLRDAGLIVDVAENGQQAIEKAQTNTYDSILMDMQMPKIDGLEATRCIRKIPGRGDIPIIAMTANAFDEDRKACLAAGMNDFVTKPINQGLLYSIVLNWLSYGKGTRD